MLVCMLYMLPGRFELVELALYWVIDNVQKLQVFSYIKHSGIEILSPACIFVLHCTAANFPLANTIQKAVSTAFFKVCRKILLEFPAKKSVRCGSGELIDPIIRSGIGDGVVSQ